MLKKFLIFAILAFLISPFLYPTKAVAVNPPVVSINAPSSASGIITVTINYSFPDDNTWMSVYISSRRIYRSFFGGGSSGALNLNLDTTYWGDGTNTIGVVAYYNNISGVGVTVSQDIVTKNTPEITVVSPSGTVRGIIQYNISYKFPSTTAGYGLFRLYRDNYPIPRRAQFLLSSTTTTEGNWQFPYDTANLSDGPHTITVTAWMGLCFTCSDIRPPNSAQVVNFTVDNTPRVKILSPSGTVRGVVNASINYDFPSTNYSQPARISLERQSLLGTYSEIASKSVNLSATEPTAGTWNFTFDVSNWDDGGYNLRAKVSYYKTNYDYATITVANKALVVPADKQAPQDKITAVGEPINVANGNMFTSTTDILIPGREIPLELSRTYNSQDDFQGEFGYGWRSNFDITLSEEADGSVIEADEKGTYTIYTPNSESSYSPSAGKYSQLTRNPDGTYTILRKYGKKLYFDSLGRLIKIETRNGNAITILRDSGGAISKAIDSSGRELLFARDSEDRVIRIEDPKNRIFKYEYDSTGNLIKAIDPLNNETLYEYDASRNLIRETDAKGNSLYFAYDSSGRAYRSWLDGNNNAVTLSFDPDNKLTTSTDSLGNATKYEYNEYGLVTKIIDSQNNSRVFSWDENLNKISSTDENGDSSVFTYDSRGNLLTIMDPLNNAVTFTYEPSFGLTSSITSALGNKTEYYYDAKGNLTQIKDAQNNTVSYSYDAQGQIFEATDANGNATGFSYDAYGNLIRITDALGNQTNFDYDIIGNVIRVTGAKGASTQFIYDALAQLNQINYPDNSSVTYAYDAAGNPISFTDQANRRTSYDYDAANRLIQVTDALGNITRYTYDTEGGRTSIIDANGNKTQYFYDSLGRLIKTIDPLNNEVTFSYDAAGNLIAKTYANGNTINYAYDKDSRLIRISYPDSSILSFAYDAQGRRTAMVDLTGATIYSYDALSRITGVDGPQDNDTISYAYDKAGNRIQMAGQDGGITTYIYDNLNRLSSLIDPERKATAYSYDSIDNLVQMTYPNHAQVNYTFDSLNRLTSLVNKLGRRIISSYSYNYDTSGMRTRATLADNGYIIYTYDNLNRLVQEQRYSQNNKLFYAFNYTYDAVGNRLTQEIDLRDFRFQMPGLPRKAFLEYAYNSDNQLTQLKISRTTPMSHLRLSQTVDYTYDLNGNLIQETSIDKNTQFKAEKAYTYDYENRLTQIEVVDTDTQAFNFAYDGLGRRISQVQTARDAQSKTRLYFYDGLNVILEKDQAGQVLASYTRGLSHGGGIGGIIGARAQDEAVERELYYHYDGAGSVTNLTTAQRIQFANYTYDAFGNILREWEPKKINPYTFSTKELDNSGLIYFGARYYSPMAGRWISEDPLGFTVGTNLYAYCLNNPTNYFDPFGEDVYYINNRFNRSKPTIWPLSHSFVAITEKDPVTGKQEVLRMYSWVDVGGGMWEDPYKGQNKEGAQAAINIGKGAWKKGDESLNAYVDQLFEERKGEKGGFWPFDGSLYRGTCKKQAKRLIKDAIKRKAIQEALKGGNK